MITVKINGKKRCLKGPTDLQAYLKSLGIGKQNFAVAYNGTVLRNDELGTVTLSEGDNVVIVRAIGGG